MRFWKLVWRGVKLRCPVCGQGKLFRGYFRMHRSCPVCEADFERESGFFLGSIYFNYGLTALIVAIAYPLLLFNRVFSNDTLLLLAVTFVVLFPFWFFRYARSLWLSFDQYWDARG